MIRPVTALSPRELAKDTAIETTTRDLIGALNGMRSTTLDRCIADMPDKARASELRVVKSGARIILQPKHRWRLKRLFLNHDTRPLASLLHECRVKLAGEIARGREGHWSFDLNRLLALQEAHLALRFMRRHGE